ncbi:MAG: adenosylmethionine--8-amino-7-oxononanoate transaminase [Planctomycetota bacterium]|nr:adenosylmethionine--8-amino-7-oxononanoate transaminase [Planctomycetota bacterium]
MPSHRELIQADNDCLWHPFTPMRQWLADTLEDGRVIVAGEGFELIDSRGGRFIDGFSSLWCNLHGHRVEAIDRALSDQLGRIAHSTLLGHSSQPAIELASRLVRIAPPGLAKVFYSDSGATAVEVALKMAYQYWRNLGRPRRRFLALREGYHGDTIGSVSLGGIDTFHRIFRPLLFEATFAASPCAYHHPAGAGAGAAVLDEIEQALARAPGEFAAVIVEPLVQGAGGILTHPRGFLSGVAQLARRHETLLIVDEVATGFCRTGSLFACSQESVSPDLMCLGKGLTGGYLPVAATLATQTIFDAFCGELDEGKTFYHGHTFTGNALGCAAACASVDLIFQSNLLDSLPGKVRRMSEKLAALAGHPNVGDIRQCGLMAGIELVADRRGPVRFDPARRVGAAVCAAMRKRGILLRPLGDVVVLMPAPAMDPATLDRLLDGVIDTLREHFAKFGDATPISTPLPENNAGSVPRFMAAYPSLPERPGLFVTGTDTGVGKTLVAGGIARCLREAGVGVEVFKPVASGCQSVEGRLVSADGEFLAACAGGTRSADEVVPLRFEAPLAPNVAGARSGDLDAIFAAYARLAESAQALVVEGVGGLLCPITDDFWVLHLAGLLQLPLVIVARAGLGTINHTLLTLRAARSAGLSVAGVVLNRHGGSLPDPSLATNASQISALGRVPILATLDSDPASDVCTGRLGPATLSALGAIDWRALAGLSSP